MSQDSAVSARAEALPEVRILRAPELGNSSFLVADRLAGDAIVIDPFRHIERYLAGAKELGVTIRTPHPTTFSAPAAASWPPRRELPSTKPRPAPSWLSAASPCVPFTHPGTRRPT